MHASAPHLAPMMAFQAVVQLPECPRRGAHQRRTAPKPDRDGYPSGTRQGRLHRPGQDLRAAAGNGGGDPYRGRSVAAAGRRTWRRYPPHRGKPRQQDGPCSSVTERCRRFGEESCPGKPQFQMGFNGHACDVSMTGDLRRQRGRIPQSSWPMLKLQERQHTSSCHLPKEVRRKSPHKSKMHQRF